MTYQVIKQSSGNIKTTGFGAEDVFGLSLESSVPHSTKKIPSLQVIEKINEIMYVQSLA
jgi:hypothetical protein